VYLPDALLTHRDSLKEIWNQALCLRDNQDAKGFYGALDPEAKKQINETLEENWAMSKEARDRKTLDDIYAAFFAGDFEKWMSYWDENSVIREAQTLPYGGDHKGSAEIRALAEKMGGLYSEFKIDFDGIFGNDDKLVAIGTCVCTGRSTGKSASFSFAEVWVFNNDKVVEVTPIYGDTALMNAIL
jgi:ketosteroid isomerase-like protein